MAKSRIDKLIDQAEATNAQIRALTEAILLSSRLSQAIPAPLPAKALLGAAPKAQELQSEAYFRAVRGLASAVQNPAAQQIAGDAARIALDSIQLVPDGPTPFTAVPIKKRSPAQKRNDKMQSQAFKNANSALRKTNGQMRKGVNQRDIAARAQRELRKLKKGTTKRVKRGGTSKRSSRSR